jgi:hypothetical protein
MFNFGYVHGSTGTDLYLLSTMEAYDAAGDTSGKNIYIQPDAYGLKTNVNGGNVELETAPTSGTGVRGKVQIKARELDMTSTKVTNLLDGAASGDAVNKSQLDTKQDSLGTGTTSQFLRGDLQWVEVSGGAGVVYVANESSLPLPGDETLLYGTDDLNQLYRWDSESSAYQQMTGVIGPAGPAGPAGVQGEQGIQGIQGAQGSVGLQGPQGIAGIQGPAGDPGIQGPAGAQGETGPAGVAGPQGEQGLLGPQGIAGEQGPAGPQGEIGPVGPQGAEGAVGPAGPQGEPGIQGSQGIQGIQGDVGPAGAQGIQGIQGLKGDKGDTGDAGVDGDRYATTSITTLTIASSGTITLTTDDLELDYSISQTVLIAHDVDDYMGGEVVSYDRATGQLVVVLKHKTGTGTYSSWQINLSGAVGVAGPAGPAGPQGEVGPAGPQGIQGIQGAPGEQGIAGPQGIQGPAGDTGPAGAKGDQGDIGPVGPQGEMGPAGAQGETGPSGPQGPQGEQGLVGPQGDAGEQGPAGPQGLQGLTGPAGPQGIQGEVGPQGLQGIQGIQGEQGVAGAKGDTGDTGPAGPQGPSGVVTAISPILYDAPTQTVSLDIDALKLLLNIPTAAPGIVAVNVPSDNVEVIGVSVSYTNIVQEWTLYKWDGSVWQLDDSGLNSAPSPLELTVTRPTSPAAADDYKIQLLNSVGNDEEVFVVQPYLPPLPPPGILNVISPNDNTLVASVTVSYDGTATNYVVEKFSAGTWSQIDADAVLSNPFVLSLVRTPVDELCRVTLSNADATSTPYEFTLYKYEAPPEVTSAPVTNNSSTTAQVAINYTGAATNYEIESFSGGSWSSVSSGAVGTSPYSVQLNRPGAGAGPLLHRVRVLKSAIAGSWFEFSVEDQDDAASFTGVSQTLVSETVQRVNFTITSNVAATYSILREDPANSGTYVAISGQGPFTVQSGVAVFRDVAKLSSARNIQIRVTADVGGHVLASTVLLLPAITPSAGTMIDPTSFPAAGVSGGPQIDSVQFIADGANTKVRINYSGGNGRAMERYSLTRLNSSNTAFDTVADRALRTAANNPAGSAITPFEISLPKGAPIRWRLKIEQLNLDAVTYSTTKQIDFNLTP